MDTLNSARSLAALDLAGIKADTRLGHQVTLTDEQHTTLLLALLDRSAAASEQIAQQVGTSTAMSVDEVAAGFHAVLTHNRYRQGPRRHTTVADVAYKVCRFVLDGSPIPLTIQGFPFKQADNRLKACGPLPDLAEFGAMLRLWELAQALRQLYPPGVRLTVMRDGGYYRPRSIDELAAYRDAVRRSLGPQRAQRWERDVQEYRTAIVQATSAVADAGVFRTASFGPSWTAVSGPTLRTGNAGTNRRRAGLSALPGRFEGDGVGPELAVATGPQVVAGNKPTDLEDRTQVEQPARFLHRMRQTAGVPDRPYRRTTSGLDFLCGAWNDLEGRRTGGVGFVDMAEQAGILTGTNLLKPSGRQCTQIDHILLSPALAGRVVPGSGCIHEPIDPDNPDSDHLRLSVTVAVN